MLGKQHTFLGAIYDVDDTLLNNQPDRDPLNNLHQQSRLIAIHKLAVKHNIDALRDVDARENYDSFAAAPVHTVAGAMWTLLRNRGVLDGEFTPNHPLILEMIEDKNTAYASLLRELGKPIPGALEFVRDFAAFYGFNDKNAIASTANRNDVDAFLEMTDLNAIIPSDHIITLESVTHPKPHPEAFDKAFRTLGLPDSARSQVLAFEDDPRGMQSARDAGLTVCAITTRYDREFLQKIEAKPDYIADSFDEFRQLFGLPPLPK